MKIPEDGKLLRVFIGEADKWQGRPLYEAIVLLAKKEGMAGATAIRQEAVEGPSLAGTVHVLLLAPP